MVLCIDVKRVSYSLGQVYCTREKLNNTRVVKMDRKWLKNALVVLDAVKSRFLETKEFIDDTLKDEFEKEKITADEIIFLQV